MTTNDCHHSLSESIEKLYRTFSRYSNWCKQIGCPCCVTKADLAPLLEKSLRDLTEDDLRLFTQLNQSLWGDLDDFRHFLPRIFELSVRSVDYPSWDIERPFRGLRLGDWADWPDEEQTAVRNLVNQWWQSTFVQPHIHLCSNCNMEHTIYGCDPKSILLSIAEGFSDVQPFLLVWRKFTTKHALVEFINGWEELELNLKHAHRAQFDSWLADSQTREWLWTGYHTYSAVQSPPECMLDLSDLREYLNLPEPDY